MTGALRPRTEHFRRCATGVQVIMPLGIVSDEAFEKELALCANNPLPKSGFKAMEGPGADSGSGPKRAVAGRSIEVPSIARGIIAEEALLGSPHSGAARRTKAAIASDYGISESSVDAYVHGATSPATYNSPDPRLAKKNDAVREQIISNARSKMLEAFGHLTSDKFSESKLRDISATARDMSIILSHQESKIIGQVGSIGAQFVFHVSETKKESEFDIIDVEK